MVPNVNTNEKPDNTERELSILQQTFNEKADIKETPEGYTVKTTLEKGELQGGQELELTIGHRKEIPVNLKDYGLTLTGLPVTEMKINGKILEGYNLYVAPFNQNDEHISSVNFADAGSRSIVMSSVREGSDLAAFFHEAGHIEKDHTTEKRGALITEVREKAINKYFDEKTGTLDDEGLKRDSEAMKAITAVYEQEIEANDEGTKILAEFDPTIFSEDSDLNKFKDYLKAEIERQYLGIYGIKQETPENNT